MSNLNVSFIGLGVMGYPMARHLQEKGFNTTVYNRTTAKAEKWVAENGGALGKTPAEAAKDADIVFMCVGNDNDLRSVVFGDNGVLETMKEGAILVDHTTTSADVAKEVAAKAAEKGITFIDGPVSGGQAGAENGVLTVMCGGDQASFDKAKPVIESFARAVTLLGPVGAGQMCKMVNQICIAGVLQGLSEGVAFAQKAGLDVDEVIGVISKGAAQSWQMENRASTMAKDEFNFGFAVDWMRKDLGIVLAEAENNGAELPMTALVDQFYAKVQHMGGGRFDTSSLIKLLR